MRIFSLMTLCFLPSLMLGSSLYNESVTGDLSNNWAAPTSLSFSPTSNQVIGTLVRTSSTNPDDKDYFTFTVPAGYQIVAINVLSGTTGGGTGVSFFAIGAGASMLDPNTTPNPALAASLLGYTLYGAADIGNSILGRLRNSNTSTPPAQGFPSLGSGTYTIWVQEGAVGTFSYGFDVVMDTPEPATWMMSLAGISLLAFARRRQ